MKDYPTLSFWQIWNVSFGFLGVQIGYSLQNGNASRILSGLGSHVEQLSWFWLAAPIAGLIVQPIIGMSSDKTWTRLGRRIPFIIGGAILATIAMFLMPNSGSFAYIMPILLFGAVMFLFMDTSFNITMQPFRALVGDMLSDKQRNRGYAIQSFLINTGAVIGSMLPFVLTQLGVQKTPGPDAKVAPTVIWSFYIGGAILLFTVLWTALTTREYPPKEYAEYHNITESEKQRVSFLTLLKDIPITMWRLAYVQFFSWFALFLIWVYSTSGVAQNVWHTLANDSKSVAFNDAGTWVGVLFACYSFFAAMYSTVLARLANRFGRKNIYMMSLFLGGVSLVSMLFIHNQYGLIFSMVGIGIAWAAILAMPYAILSASLPASKMGVYMGIFNATITIPQITAGLFGGAILIALGGHAIYMLGVAGISMVLAAVCVVFVKEHHVA